VEFLNAKEDVKHMNILLNRAAVMFRYVMSFLWYAMAFNNKFNVVLLAGDLFIVSRFET
jgi:hypothetical protein